MVKKPQQRSFNDVLAHLGSQKFDVSAPQEGARRAQPAIAGAVRVSKFGCAAEIAAAPKVTATTDAAVSSVILTAKPGFLLNGEIARLLDRGYQKFIKTSKLEIPATAAHLRAIHEFTTELNAATGEMTLFNESLGTTSDTYQYDRVLGRPDQPVR